MNLPLFDELPPPAPEPGVVRFHVAGEPAQKGSMRAFMPKGARYPIVTNDSKKTRAWESLVSLAAQAAMVDAAQAPFDVPVRVAVRFTMTRPRSHLTSKGALAKGAPLAPQGKPDLDKLARAVLDALTGIVFVDDSRVCDLVASKVYGPAPGAQIVVATL